MHSWSLLKFPMLKTSFKFQIAVPGLSICSVDFTHWGDLENTRCKKGTDYVDQIHYHRVQKESSLRFFLSVEKVLSAEWPNCEVLWSNTTENDEFLPVEDLKTDFVTN